MFAARLQQLAQTPMSKRLFSAATMRPAHQTIKTQYLMQVAQVKLHLPKEGDCWFFIKPQDTVSQFLQSVKSEDADIKEVDIVTTNGKKVVDSDIMYQKLQDSKTPIFLRLNGSEYKFDDNSLARDLQATLSDTCQWFDQCKAAGLSNFHATTISTALREVEKNLATSAEPVEEKKTKARKTKAAAPSTTVDSVLDTFIDQSHFFENSIVREQVFQLHALKLLTQAQFDKSLKRKQEIEAQERSRHMLRVWGFTSFYTAQFLLSGYAIFYVEWLGWDLVEPVTFSVT